MDDSISAYLFNLLDTEGAPSGYIIIGASTDYAPIIEYSHDHEPFVYLNNHKNLIIKKHGNS